MMEYEWQYDDWKIFQSIYHVIDFVFYGKDLIDEDERVLIVDEF
jgi:hypothetical protein